MPSTPKSPDRTATTAVVTVSHRSGGVLPAFLASVDLASAEPPLVIVADNSQPEDPDAATICSTFGARFVHLPSNHGYGSAVNEAIALLPPNIEWVLISNPDVVLAEGSLDRLLESARADSSVGAVGPRILTVDGDVYPSARALPRISTGIGHSLFGTIWEKNPWTTAYRVDDRPGSDGQREAGWLSGACLLIRRSLFDALGGFDQSYFMYFEDVDLGARIGAAGFRNVYEPAATVTHIGAHSTTTASERMIRAHHESAKRYLARLYSGAWAAPVRLAIGVGLDARAALLIRKTRRADTDAAHPSP